jgi:hypothetical protein
VKFSSSGAPDGLLARSVETPSGGNSILINGHKSTGKRGIFRESQA